MRFRISSFTAFPLAVLLAVTAGCGSSGKSPTALDTVAPTVSSTNPVNGATSVTVITASFSEAMEASTLTTTTFDMRGPGGIPVAGSVACNASTDLATFVPTQALAAGTTYTATITTGATDLAGNALTINHVWRFTTSSSTPPPVPHYF